jgi:trimethylamine:corrinoid methyltransferase-like protein
MPAIEPIRPKLELEVLSYEELASIKSATLHILENVGVHFPSERALGILAAHGAKVDRHSQIAKLPPDLVVEAMHHAPRSYCAAFLCAGRASRGY